MLVYKEKDFLNPRENINIFKSRYVTDEPLHTHEFAELVYIYLGSAKHRIGGHEYDVEEGDLLFIDVGQTHSFYDACGMCYVNILLKPEFVSGELINSSNIFEVFTLSAFDDFDGEIEQSVRVVSFTADKIITVRRIIDALVDEFEKKELGYKSAICGYIDVLFAEVLRAMQRGKNEGDLKYIGKIAPQILTYIEDNLAEKIALGDLAARCFYTPSYFCRVFRRCYGMPLKSYVKQKRVERAEKYLRESDYTVEEIIDRVGYGERTLFFKHFKELTGKTPNEFRREKQKKPQQG